MNSTTLEQLGNGIDESFFIIGLAILAIEIIKGIYKKTLGWRGIADMLSSISTQIPFLFVEVFILASAYGLYSVVYDNYVSWGFGINPVSIVLAVLVADFVYYWEHRLAHEVRILWIHHAVHHSSRHMNISTGIRFGPFEGVWSLVIMFSMVLIGFPSELIIFGSLVVLAYQTWIHTELFEKLGPLELLLNTPSHHRVHHGCDPEYLDKNYGGILIIWDRMFGTFQEEMQTPRYGLARDFDSVNPLKVWFSELPEFFKDIANSKSLSELRKRVFGPPHWEPVVNNDPGSSLAQVP